MTFFSKPWGFGSVVLGSVAALGLIAASTTVRAQAPATPTVAAAHAPVTFTKDVAPILQRSCVVCHRPDQIAPMSLKTYEDARPYARSIKNRVVSRIMPPWHIERNVGITTFKNDPSLTEDEIATIAAWVDQGAPKGNPADMPAQRVFGDEDQTVWNIGKPDLIVPIPAPYTVKAAAPDVFIDFISESGLMEDRYVRAVEAKPGPGAQRVMHHLLTYVQQTLEESEKLVGQDAVRSGSTEMFLNEYALGKNGDILPENTGKLIKAGSKIRFNIHYHSSGKDTVDRSMVGMIFYPKGYVPKYHQISLQTATTNPTLDLPAGQVTRNDGYYRFDTPVRITAVQMHAHNLGKRMCLEVILPNNSTEQLNCMGWTFSWHKVYNYTDDVMAIFPAGSILHSTLWHDNSTANRANPDPRNWRGGGDRTMDEMGFSWTTWTALTDEDYKAMLAEKQKRNSN